MFNQLDPFGSDQSHQTLDLSVIRMLIFVASWQSRHLSVTKKSKKNQLEMVSDQTNVRLNLPLIRPFPSWSDFWSYHPQTKVISDHTIPRPKWPLIILSPDRSDLWSYHPQTEVTSDHTIVRWNQIPDPVILVWEHTVCVGLGLIRGHFRMAPQPGMCNQIMTLIFALSHFMRQRTLVSWTATFKTFKNWKTFVSWSQ